MEKAVNRFLYGDEENMPVIGVNATHGFIHADFPLHCHEFNETFIIVSGSASHILGDWRYPLSRGDVFAIKGDMVHGFWDVNDLCIINLMYKPTLFQQSYSEIRSIPGFDSLFLVEPEIRQHGDYPSALKLSDEALNYVIMMTDFIIEQQKQNNKALYPVIKMTFQALLSYLATQYNTSGGVSSQITALSRATSFMEQRLADRIKLADIAASVYLSPRHLERLFDDYYGESPMKYLAKMRLKRAMTLLVLQKVSVAAAARQSGFDDVSYFARIFRTTYGISPSAAKKLISEM